MDSIEQLPPLRDVISQHGLNAEKSLGQNFLLDLNLTDKIVRLAGNVQGLHIIEIGPGPGGLTRALLKAGAHVTAIDLDRRISAVLAPLIEAAHGKLRLIEGDALQENFLSYGDNGKRALVANLPYNVATPLLIHFLSLIHAHGAQAFSFMHLMFQKEVADRIVASPGSKTYGRLSVMCQWLCTVKTALVLPPSAFTPPPKVHSAIVHFVPIERADNLTFSHMEQIVAKAFGQRRKMMRAIFKGMDDVLQQAGIDPTDRAETICIEKFVRLAELLI